jgi:uncharacterized repeat protein (TIGR03843 family)
VAAYLVSEALGWNIVPRTWLRDGPFGEGMVQLWQETDPKQTAVDLVPAEDVPDTGWKQILEGEDQSGRTVALIHEDTPALRRMAVFDVLVNNADRKGDHILAMADGHRYGVDHGLTFHSDHKLRTVLWGWIGEALSAEELAGIDRVLSGLEGELGRNLDKLLTPEEFASLGAGRRGFRPRAAKCQRFAGRFSKGFAISMLPVQIDIPQPSSQGGQGRNRYDRHQKQQQSEIRNT